MEFITENWGALVAALLALVGLADMIAKFTTTKKDDAVIDKIKAILPVLFPNGGKKKEDK